MSILLDADALAGIAKPARASVSISIDTPMNAEARAGFAPEGPTGLFGRYLLVLRPSLVHLLSTLMKVEDLTGFAP